MMPVLDGFEVLRRLKADPALRVIPVIMLTARGQERDVLTGRRGGAAEGVACFLARLLAALWPASCFQRLRMSTRAGLSRLAAALAASVLAGCGGGDPLPAGSAGPSATVVGPPEPAPPAAEPPAAPSTPAVNVLRLDGVAVQPPFRLAVTRKAVPGGDRYRFEIAALDWEVEFDLETARLGVEATGATLTSDFLVPDGGLVLRKLTVNGTRLGTTGTAHGAFDPCAGADQREHDEDTSRTGLIFGRLSRLDSLAVGRFQVTGTDDRCRALEGTIELSARVR